MHLYATVEHASCLSVAVIGHGILRLCVYSRSLLLGQVNSLIRDTSLKPASGVLHLQVSRCQEEDCQMTADIRAAPQGRALPDRCPMLAAPQGRAASGKRPLAAVLQRRAASGRRRLAAALRAAHQGRAFLGRARLVSRLGVKQTGGKEGPWRCPVIIRSVLIII